MKNKFFEILARYPKVMRTISSAYNLFFGEMLLFYYLFRIFPIKRKKILFCSYYGKGYGDNPKYIAEEIIRQGLDYELVWLLKKGLEHEHGLPSQIRHVRYGSLRAVYEYVTSRVWVDNSRKTGSVRKRKGQFYIQTWHGSLGIKRCEKDAEQSLDRSYIDRAKNDSKMADLFLANCNYIKNMFENSFWYDGEIMNNGLPRNDLMFTDTKEVKRKICKLFGLDTDIKIALYAPTFRKSYTTDVYDIDYQRCLKALEKRFDGEWVFFIRLHPNMSDKDLSIEYGDQIINVSNYLDGQELFVSTDFGVSDYSAVMYDFGLRRIPSFLYTPDIDEYMKDRNFNFSLYDLPFIITRNNEELEQAILKFNEEEYLQRLEAHLKPEEITDDGKASSRVVKWINSRISDY